MGNNNSTYFEDIARKIDQLEHPERYNNVTITDSNGSLNEYGEVDSDQRIITIVQPEVVTEGGLSPIDKNLADVEDVLPTIDKSRIDGVVQLYKDLNARYGSSKLDPEKIDSISGIFKQIIDPDTRDVYVAYLREYIDRLRWSLLQMLSNTVYSLITKLTREETIQSLTIMERMTLLDKLFEYMDKVNNMMNYVPVGDTKTELMEINQREENVTGVKKERNRDLEQYVLNLLKQ